MTTTVVVGPVAERELTEAIDWYDRQKPGLGRRFGRELRQFLKAVAEKPERFRAVTRLTRKARLPSWPYSVYFMLQEHPRQMIVTAVWHDRRDPTQLRQRLR